MARDLAAVFEEPYPWHLANRNKRGMAIDLKSPAASRFSKSSSNGPTCSSSTRRIRPQAAEARIRGRREVEPAPDLCGCHGFRRQGTGCRAPRFDITSYWARSGLLSMTRDAGAPPTWPVAGSGDNATAVASTRRS